MPSTDLAPATLVEDAAGVDQLASHLASQGTIAVDTESNSLHAYREQVCLVQFSTPVADFVVDTLAVSNLDALRPVFAEARIEKVFHAAEYDVICLKRDFGFEVHSLFDTMVAARTLGWPQTGLATLLESQFGIKVSKRLQRSDWAIRPLTPEALEYARLDTHHLIPLRHRLHDELVARERWPEAREEFERLSRISGSAATFDPDGYWRIAGARELRPPQAAVLRSLYHFREATAERINRPPFKVIGDKTLLAIARDLPRTEAELRAIPGMTAGQVQRYGQGIFEAVHDADHRRGGPRPPLTRRVDDLTLARYEALRTWRKKKAQSRQVESDVIIPREVLWEIARRAPRTNDELANVPGLMPWRLATYGKEILEAMLGVES